MKGILAILLVGLALLCSQPLQAAGGEVGGEDPKEIERLSSLALELARSGRMEDAIYVWRSLREKVDGSARSDVDLNLAVAHKKLGYKAAAWFYLSQYVAVRPEDAKAVRQLGTLERSLRETHARVTFTCSSPEVHLQLADGPSKSDWPCPLTWWLAPGEHRVAAVMGEFFLVVPVSVDASRADVAVDVPALAQQTPGTERAAGAGGAGSQVGRQAEGSSQGDAVPVSMEGSAGGGGVSASQQVSSGNTPAIVTTVMGAALVLGGGLLHFLAYSEEDSLASKYPSSGVDYATFVNNRSAYNQGYEDKVEPLNLSAYVLYGLGGAALVGGLSWLIWGDSGGGAEVSAGPSPDGGWMVGVAWSFGP